MGQQRARYCWWRSTWQTCSLCTRVYIYIIHTAYSNSELPCTISFMRKKGSGLSTFLFNPPGPQIGHIESDVLSPNFARHLPWQRNPAWNIFRMRWRHKHKAALVAPWRINMGSVTEIELWTLAPVSREDGEVEFSSDPPLSPTPSVPSAASPWRDWWKAWVNFSFHWSGVWSLTNRLCTRDLYHIHSTHSIHILQLVQCVVK